MDVETLMDLADAPVDDQYDVVDYNMYERRGSVWVAHALLARLHQPIRTRECGGHDTRALITQVVERGQ